eukprot:TRINITY_DN27135_c0_g1_i1.p1 TRINITY_DN27135_c0_g1~~TRINITY_DN27135_c0_g1_i1.p1  ORF type:complete len:119 (+),score=5.29 TRINITY_DN27135_c0_g1_i1:61-417(+)
MCIRDSGGIALAGYSLFMGGELKSHGLAAKLNSDKKISWTYKSTSSTERQYALIEDDGIIITGIESYSYNTQNSREHHMYIAKLKEGIKVWTQFYLSLIHICRCRRYAVCRSRWSPYH